jgi:HK97 family phage major capsid protein
MTYDTDAALGCDPRGYETRTEGGGEEQDDSIAEVRTAVEDFTASAQQGFVSIDTTLSELRQRLERTETTLRRPGVGTENRGEDARAVEHRAFVHFIRQGMERLSVDEVRSLRVSDDTAGGYLAPDQFQAELLRNVVLFSPVRGVARVAGTSSAAVLLPKRTGRMTAQWVGEGDDRPETTITYGQNRYPVCELTAYVDVSNANLEDSAFDVAAELAFDFAEEFGKAEGAAFVNGSSQLSPIGFMQNTEIAYTPGGDASAITAGGLIDLYHALPTPYRTNAVWGMNSAALGKVRKLQDPSTGTYLLITSGIANAPATTLLGRPVVEMPDMPDVSGNAYPIIFGDFMNGYRIFDRVALSILRDPYSQATKGMTRFHGRRRVAGGVAKPEALRKLKIATS